MIGSHLVSSGSLFALALALAAGSGCSLDEGPQNPSFVEVFPVATSVTLPGGEILPRRYLVDGLATDPEWSEVPYTYISVGPENGNQGGSFIVAMKATHDSERIYMLLQWPDATQDRLGPRLVWNPERNLTPSGCDTLLLGCAWDLIEADEDRVAVMWDMGDARDNAGTFRERGCQVACHGNMHPVGGSVDIWQWRAARTNPLNFPLSGSYRVGFADDGFANGAGRVEDSGLSFYRNNYQFVPCGDGSEQAVPRKIPVALDSNQQPTTRINDNMRPCEYIYDPTGSNLTCNSRANPCRQFEQVDVLEWVAGDDLSATLLNRPANSEARRSRHDVEARGRWEEVVSPGGEQIKGTWTLEMSRILSVGNADDIQFDPQRQEPYYLAIAFMNNSGRIHSGTPVIELRFQQ